MRGLKLTSGFYHQALLEIVLHLSADEHQTKTQIKEQLSQTEVM